MAFYEENPQGIGKADMIVAIPTFNEVDNIGFAVRQTAKGLVEYFGGMNTVIVHCDNHSTDGTKEAFFAAPCEVPRIHISTAPGVHGKGNNLRNLFEKVRQMEAKAVVVLEADTRNIAPRWVRNLGEPLFKGAGYTVPLFVRHKYEATLTTSIIYPLMRCLYGRRIRQPNIGDFGFKGELADTFLNAMWTDSVAQYGIDIWMTTVALNSRVPICQSVMGSPKVHREKDPYTHLTVLFQQVVRTMFDLMDVYSGFWKQVKWSKPAGLFGTDIQEMEIPLPVEINASRLYDQFRQGFDKYENLWKMIFEQPDFHRLQEIRGMELQHFSFPTHTWAKILFDASGIYRKSDPAARIDLLDSLLPLYFGKVLSYVKKTERMSLQQAEEYIENECTVFEENKPYIVKAWE